MAKRRDPFGLLGPLPLDRLRPQPKPQPPARKPYQAPRGLPSPARLPTPADTRRQALRQDDNRYRKQVVSNAKHDVLAVLGQAPPRHEAPPAPMRLPLDRLLNPHPKAPVGPSLADVRTDINTVLLKPGTKGKTGAIERLQQAGIVDPRGTQTWRQRRQAAIDTAVAIQQQSLGGGKLGAIARVLGTSQTAPPRELAMMLRHIPTRNLEAGIEKYRPSAVNQAQIAVNQASINPLGALALVNAGAAIVGEGARGAGNLTGSKLIGNALSDAVQYPIQGPSAIAQIGMAIPDKKVRKQVVEGLTQGVIGHALHKDFKGAGEYAKEHPLFAALEVAGGATGLARGVAAPIRFASGGRLLGTARTPLDVGEGIGKARTYSKDPIRRVFQKAYDTTLADSPNTVRLYGEDRAAKLAPTRGPVARDSHGRSRGLLDVADLIASRANSLERMQREADIKFARGAAPVREHRGGRIGQAIGGAIDRTLPSAPIHDRFSLGILPKRRLRPERDVVSLVLEGVIKPGKFAEGLRDEASRIGEELKGNKYKSPAERLAARQRLEAVSRVLNDPRARANEKGVFESARRLAPRFKELQDEAIAKGVLDERSARAALFPAAQVHLGAERQKWNKETDRRYQQAKATEAAARTRLGEVDANLTAAKSKRDRLSGANTVRRGHDPMRPTETVPQTRARLRREADREGARQLAEQQVARFKAERKQARKQFEEARIARKNASKRQIKTRMVVDGEAISTPDLIARLEDAGVDTSIISHLPHNLRLRGAAAYHAPFATGRYNYQGDKSRSGSLFKRGASPYDYNHVLETIVGRGGRLANIDQFDRAVRDIGIRGEDGNYMTVAEAEARRENLGRDSEGNLRPGREELVPFRAFSRSHDPALADAAQSPMRKVRREEDMEEAFKKRLDMKSNKGARNVVLVPRTVIERWQDHISAAREGSATGQMLSSGFRRAVLPFSARWVFGNTFEAALRLVIAGSIPVADNVIGRHVVRQMLKMDKQQADAFVAEFLGGTVSSRGLSVRRTARQTATGRYGEVVANLPVVKEVKDSLIKATDVGFNINRFLEREGEYAALGKFARERLVEMHGSWAKAMVTQRRALDDVSKGLTGTTAQVQFAQYLNETLGQYSRFSPGVRKVIQTYAPFMPWYMNAARFVAITLPFKHTLAAAVLTKTEATFQKDFEDQHSDTPPGDLRTAIRRKDGGYTDLGRYTPFGFLGPVAAHDLSGIGQIFTPQAQGLIKALSGQDAFGRKLPEGTNQLGYIANLLAEQSIPGLSQARRLREGGRTSIAGSNIFHTKTKPGTNYAGGPVNKVFNPLAPVYLHPPGGETSTGDASAAPTDPVRTAIRQALAARMQRNGAVDEAVRQALLARQRSQAGR